MTGLPVLLAESPELAALTREGDVRAFATLPIDELTHGDARAHVSSCRDCDRVSRVVAERERNMLMAFGELYPPTPADPIATRALEISRRRRVSRLNHR